MQESGLNPPGRGRRNAQTHGDPVGGLEADPEYVEGEAVRVLLDHRDRLVPVGLPDPGREGGRDSVGLEENHQISNFALLDPGFSDRRAPEGSHTLDLQEPLGTLVDHLQRLQPEMIHQAARHHRADAADQPGAQIFLDSHQRRRPDGPERLDPELFPVFAVDRPLPLEAQALPRLDAEEVSYGRHRLPPPGHRQADHAPGVLLVGEDDPLENAFQAGGCEGFIHRLFSRVAGSGPEPIPNPPIGSRPGRTLPGSQIRGWKPEIFP